MTPSLAHPRVQPRVTSSSICIYTLLMATGSTVRRLHQGSTWNVSVNSTVVYR